MSEHFPILKFTLPEVKSPLRNNFLPYPKIAEGDPEHLLRASNILSFQTEIQHQLRLLSTNVPSEDISYIESAEIGEISIRFKDGTTFYSATTTRNTEAKLRTPGDVIVHGLGLDQRVAFIGRMYHPDGKSFGVIISVRMSAHLYPASGGLRFRMGDPVLLSVEDGGPFIEDIETKFFLGDQEFEYGFMPKIAVRIIPKEAE